MKRAFRHQDEPWSWGRHVRVRWAYLLAFAALLAAGVGGAVGSAWAQAAGREQRGSAQPGGMAPGMMVPGSAGTGSMGSEGMGASAGSRAMSPGAASPGMQGRSLQGYGMMGPGMMGPGMMGPGMMGGGMMSGGMMGGGMMGGGMMGAGMMGPGMMGGGSMAGSPLRRFQMLATQLGVTPEQRQKLRQSGIEHWKAMIPQRAALSLAEVELHQAAFAEPYEAGKVTALVRKAEALRSEIELARIGYLRSVWSILNPEQREQMLEMLGH
ncbi:MAG: periplasmic heavy metal sensor [Candidatus Tectomicrobia bacterium]|nr:periplasmic heavy metal sensor [Candidatus Tectomicrobia bacterium]